MTTDRLLIGLTAHFKHTTRDYTLQITITQTHTSFLSHGMHESYAKGIQRPTFHFLWVPQFSPSSATATLD